MKQRRCNPTMWKIPLLATLLCIFIHVSDSKIYTCERQDSPSSVSFIICYTGCCGSNYTTHCCNITTTVNDVINAVGVINKVLNVSGKRANINVSTTTTPDPAPSVSRWVIVCAFSGSVIVATVIATIILYFVCCSQPSVPKDHESHQCDSKMAEGYNDVLNNGYDPNNKLFQSMGQQKKY